MRTTSRTITAGLALTGALAITSTASAATPSLFSAGAKVRKYSLSVDASKVSSAIPGRKATTSTFASVGLFRVRGGASQGHSVSASKHIKYSAKANLSSATLKASFGKYGKVSMHFRATGRKHRALPKGCKGTAPLSRKGILSGTLKVRLDSNYFRTIRKRRLAATLSTPGRYTCSGPRAHFPRTKLSLGSSTQFNANRPYYSVSFGKDTKNRVTESASFSASNAKTGVTITRSIFATGGKSRTFTAAKSLKTAKVVGFGPWFGGVAKFKGTPQGTTFANGTLTGSFVAKFDSGGHKRLPKGGTASLSNQTGG